MSAFIKPMPAGNDIDHVFLTSLAQLQTECLNSNCVSLSFHERLCDLLQSLDSVEKAEVIPQPNEYQDTKYSLGKEGPHEYQLILSLKDEGVFSLYIPFLHATCASLRRARELRYQKESVEFFEHILDAAHEGYWEWRPSEGYSYFSTKLKEMLGYKDNELSNDQQTWDDLLHPDDCERVIESSKTILGSPTNYYEMEFRLLCKTGEYKWVLSRAKTIAVDGDGNAKRVIGMHIDIQKQKELEESLRRANHELFLEKELLTKSSSLANIGSWATTLYDGSDEYDIQWSDMTRKIHDVPSSYVPSLENGIDFYKEGWSRDLIKKAFEACASTGKPFDEELILVTDTGKEKWVRALGQRDDSEPGVTRLFGLFQDIDETKNTLKALEESQEKENILLQRLQLATSAAQIGVWDWDLTNSMLSWDDAMYRIYGVEKGAFNTAYDAWVDSLHPDDVDFAKEQIRLAIEGVKAFDCDFRIVQKDGSVRYLSAKAITLHDKNRNATRMIGVNRDITSEKHLEIEQERARIAAEEANDSKSRFLANMSHEIRTPMNGVLGMLHLVLQNELDAKTRKKLDIALKSAKSLLTIINDILDFSKIEANKLVLEETNFSLSDVLETCINNVSQQAASKSLDFNVDLASVVNSFVKGDPVRIEQILNNLLSNAVKFTKQGGIEVATSLVDYGKFYKFDCQVKDTGIGIPNDKLEFLFEAFSQVDASTTRQYGGTGLGLAICLKLCQLMDGDISVESEEGAGSIFKLTLRLNKSDSHYTPKNNVFIKNSNVLVLDSESFHIKTIINMLEKNEVTVFSKAFDACSEQDLLAVNYIIGDEPSISKLLDTSAYRKLLAPILVVQSSPYNEVCSGALGHTPFRFVSAPILPSAVMEALKELHKTKSAGYEVKLTQKDRFTINDQTMILVVDDNESNRDVAEGLLEECGYTCETATNGQEAIEILNAADHDKFKLILMDIQMPKINGYEATKHIRNGNCGDHLKNITIVAMTANAMVGDREKCLDSGMNDYLPKPIDPQSLERIIDTYLSSDVSITNGQ